MALLRRQLHKKAKGPVLNDEDWWDLVFDTASRRLYVEHRWEYVDVRGGGAVDEGTDKTEIGDFLKAGGGPEYLEVHRLLESLFTKER